MLVVSELLAAARGERVARLPARYGERGPGPAVVVWNTCTGCNQRCPHCYAGAGAPAGGLPLPDALALVDALVAGGVGSLILSGGEPLLRDDLEPVAERAASGGLAVHLSTNGLLLTPRRARSLAAAGVRTCGVSIDGPERFNDRWRGRPGDFSRAVAGLRSAAEEGMGTCLRMTLSSANAVHLDAVFDLALELGVRRLYLSWLVPSGRASARLCLPRPLARASSHRVFELAGAPRARALQVVTGGNDSEGPLLVRWIRGRFGPAAARAARALLAERGGNSSGERLLCVGAGGRVHPDPFWRSADLGSLLEGSLSELLSHPLLAALRRREDLLQGRCGRCPHLPLCRGSHRQRALAIHGSAWAPDPGCLLVEEELLGAAA